MTPCMPMDELNILHVDDDPQTLTAIREILQGRGMRVSSVETSAKGLATAAAQSFDVIVLDRTMPEMDGITVIQRLREAGVTTPVLMLSALGLSSNRTQGLDAGADDYLAKPFEPEELVARINALHRRSRAAGHSPTLIVGALECHLKARTAWRRGKHIALSPREFDLFRYFMENAGAIVTREMLLRNVWKLNFDPQTNVIDVSVARLRRKLEEDFPTPVLETVRGAGYRLMSDDI